RPGTRACLITKTGRPGSGCGRAGDPRGPGQADSRPSTALADGGAERCKRRAKETSSLDRSNASRPRASVLVWPSTDFRFPAEWTWLMVRKLIPAVVTAGCVTASFL